MIMQHQRVIMRLQWMVAALLYCISAVSAQFTELPSDQTVAEGNPVTVTCTYPGAISLVWRKNNSPILDNSPFFSISSANSSSSLTINSADHNRHAGSYQCVALTGSNENRVTNFTITVQYINNNIDITVTYDECYMGAVINSTITLDCLVPDSVPMPNVSWYRNGNKLCQGNITNIVFSRSKQRMMITILSTNDAGNYHCQAVNSHVTNGTRVSGQKRITVMRTLSSRVSIMDASNVLFAKEGDSAEIECRITPPPDVIRVRWKHSSEFLTSGRDGYVLRVDSICVFTLRINSVSQNHEGTYRCELDGVNNEDPPISAERTLRIARLNSAYALNATPYTDIGVGRELQLNCFSNGSISGNVPAIFRWSFLNVNGSEMNVRNSVERVNGGASLHFSQVELGDTGMYTCIAENPLATSVTASINITIEAPPTVSIVPASMAVRFNTSLSLLCMTNSQRSVRLSWTFNGSAVTPSTRHTTVAQGQTSVLNISDLMESDLGSYTCTVSDPIHLPVSANVAVVETSDLYFVGGMVQRPAQISNGSELVLDCPVRRGRGNVSVQWLKGTERLRSGGRVTVSSDGRQLILDTVTLVDDMTVYTCRATDDVRSIDLNFRVNVTVPGNIVMCPSETDGMVGGRVQLDCLVTGKPLPSVMWLFNQRMITVPDDSRIVNLGNGSLVISPLATEHAGTYRCYITDKFCALRLVVQPQSRGGGEGFRLGDLNRSESILVLGVCCAVVVLFLLSTLIILLLCCFYCTTQKRRSGYDLSTKESPEEFKQQPSLHKNDSGIMTQSGSTNLYGNHYHSHASLEFNSPIAIPLTTYGGRGGSVISDSIQQSHTPSPILTAQGNIPMSSLYSLEDHVSVTTNLPNFPRANLKVGDVMGDGEFGPVLSGWAMNILPTEERTQVAIKVLLPRGDDGEEGFQPELALVDFANQMKLEYDNVATILGMCTDNEPYYIIYEYLDRGDLKKYLTSCRPEESGDDVPVLTQQDLKKIILQVANGMAYLFCQHIIHGDLATRNCLVSSELKVKIADLGIGHDLYTGDYHDNGSQLLPIRWMPPELLVDSDGPSFSLQSDIWSFGVLCWEVFTYARLPYEDLSDREVLERIPMGLTLPIPEEGCPSPLYSIMEDCWNLNHEDRPSFAKLCVAIIDLELD